MSKGKTQGSKAPRLYTVASDVPFLDTLARAILSGDLPVAGGKPPGKLDLTRWTVLLPTRRAARALTEAFLRITPGTAMLLPRIRPLGDVDEDALALSAPPDLSDDAELALSLAPAIGAMERRLALTKLVLKWSGMVAVNAGDEGFRTRATPAQASSLAVQLAALMDSLDTEQVDLGKLKELVPERFADHWQMTLEFLKIVTEHWPRHLEEQGLMAPYARRDALMAAETDRLLSSPPDAPVIAAGSTGTVPATAALLEAVAMLPNGAVVLPGLDLDLDEDSWEAIAGPVPHPEHPQFGMNQFLARIRVMRADVMALGAPATGGRTQLISEALRPAGTTQMWLGFAQNADREVLARSLEGIARIDAPTEQDEAEVISLLLRNAVEQPGCVAALVTPDRILARRVSVRLEKWGLNVDDSAGRPLDKTLPGSFMDALGEAAGSGFAPVALLALLKHPLTRLGRTPGNMRRAARHLELAAFRQPATGKGLKAHREAVERARSQMKEGKRVHSALKRLNAEDWNSIGELLDDLEKAVLPLTEFFKTPNKDCPLSDLLRAHVQAGQALSSDDGASSAALWRGEAGEALAGLFESLLTTDGADLEIAPRDYPELYRSFVAGVAVRPRAPTHPRIHIWGPLEARLQRPDMIVLGGLNEGTWPASQESDPWLSRPMRAEVGLSAPERDIGRSAHDVAQLMGVGQIYLTRAEKVGGAPTVPSRWLLRLDAVLDALDLKDALEPKSVEPWLGWARARDNAPPVEPVSAPEPRPPLDARPKRLSVTRIEPWIANPYAIFAQDILKLDMLEELAGEPGAALKGTLIHNILQGFTEAHPEKLPSDIASELMRFARMEFEQFADKASIETFWRGQFGVFSRWFAATEPGRRKGVKAIHAEASGALRLGNDFTLSGRADRIDEREDGTLAIYDYKTGLIPTTGDIDKARAPQLPLEAVMAGEGAFEGIPALPVSRLAYISARGYGVGGEERDASKALTVEDMANEAREKLEGLIAAYADETQPYRALRRSDFKKSSAYRYDNYAHLARVKEWQAAGEEED